MNKAQLFLLLTVITFVLFLLAVRYSMPSRELVGSRPTQFARFNAAVGNELKLYENEVAQMIKSSLPEIKRYNVKPKKADPPTLEEVHSNLTWFLRTLHDRFVEIASPQINPYDVWETYVEVTKNTLIKWDDNNKINGRYHEPRNDGSIFASVSTYRDHLCPMTIKNLFSKAANPEKVFVAIFQQNCFETKCRTGVLVGGKIEDTTTDINCYTDFCASPEGIRSNACNTGQVRLFNVNESESLGPYMARYLSGKFYQGEQYYLQIDSHSEFVQDWDHKLIKMVKDAPAKRPIISSYPPAHTGNWQDTPGARMCDSTIAQSQIEWHIIRLEATPQPHMAPSIPDYAPFVAAGFMFGGASLLHDVPFDPLLPWIFMGEEISMSARLWTAGYDIFSPTINVLNHYYVRRHYPKFWETVNRIFKRPIHNELVEIVIKRVKNMLGYSESATENVFPKNILYRLEDWSMGNRRSLASYMKMVGLDVQKKIQVRNEWCSRQKWPESALPFKYSK